MIHLTHLGDRARCLALPVALCAIALHQIVLVHAERLTPWKGGGFGMFSTVESGASRVVRVFLVKRDGDRLMHLPVAVPTEMRSLLEDLAQRPTEKGARELALLLTHVAWAESPDLDALDHMSAESFGAAVVGVRHGGQTVPALERLLRVPRAWIPDLASTAAYGPGRPLAFDQAVVEIWQLGYERDTRTLAMRRLVEAWGRGAPVASGGQS